MAEAERPQGAAAEESGWARGRDPRDMSQAELLAMGHEPMSPTRAIRLHCLDCCAGSADEVHKCMALKCPSWPFRMGRSPWRTISEGRREAGRRLAAQQPAISQNARSNLSSGDGNRPGGHSGAIGRFHR
jgi:hypothetical protein